MEVIDASVVFGNSWVTSHWIPGRHCEQFVDGSYPRRHVAQLVSTSLPARYNKTACQVVMKVMVSKSYRWFQEPNLEGMLYSRWLDHDLTVDRELFLHCHKCTFPPLAHKMCHSLYHSSFQSTALWNSCQSLDLICCRYQCKFFSQWSTVQGSAQGQWENNW